MFIVYVCLQNHSFHINEVSNNQVEIESFRAALNHVTNAANGNNPIISLGSVYNALGIIQSMHMRLGVNKCREIIGVDTISFQTEAIEQAEQIMNFIFHTHPDLEPMKPNKKNRPRRI